MPGRATGDQLTADNRGPEMTTRNDHILILLRQAMAEARASLEEAQAEVARYQETLDRLDTAMAVLESLPLPTDGGRAASHEEMSAASTARPVAPPPSNLPPRIKEASIEILRRAGGPLRLQQIVALMRQAKFF